MHVADDDDNDDDDDNAAEDDDNAAEHDDHEDDADDDDDDDDDDHDDDDDPYRSGQTMAFDRNITICITIAIIIPVTTAPTFHFDITLRYITLQCIRLHNITVQYIMVPENTVIHDKHCIRYIDYACYKDAMH